MPDYVAALDQGTTSTRCMVFDHGGNVVSVDQREHEQIYPQPGWVEHDPMEIWQRSQEVMEAAKSAAGGNVAAVGITNQRETTVVWNRNTGKPVYNAIVWQDTRTDKICDELMKDGGQDRFRAKNGLPIATYFSGPKVRWILENVDGTRAMADAGELAFGNMDTWCIWNLTGGTNGGLHITDVSNASRTMLMNLETLDWDDTRSVHRALPMGRSRPGRSAASRWPATWATSRRRRSARRRSRSARPRTRMGPATSCCSTRVTRPSSRRTG